MTKGEWYIAIGATMVGFGLGMIHPGLATVAAGLGLIFIGSLRNV